MEKLIKILEENNFINWDEIIGELKEEGETKISMMFDETPDLLDPINKLSDFLAYIDPSTDFLIIEKLS